MTMGDKLFLKPQNDIMWNPSSADWPFTLNPQTTPLMAETSLNKLAISEKKKNSNAQWKLQNVTFHYYMQRMYLSRWGKTYKRRGHYVATSGLNILIILEWSILKHSWGAVQAFGPISEKDKLNFTSNVYTVIQWDRKKYINYIFSLY